MSEAKPKTAAKQVEVVFDAKKHFLTADTKSCFGVEIEFSKDGSKAIGKCSAEELKAFEDAGKV